jgi:hypothetical protein
MVRSKGMTMRERCSLGIFAVLLAFIAIVLLAVQPVVANAAEKDIPVTDKDGKQKVVKVKYDSGMTNISATMDGKPVKVSGPNPYPIQLGDHTRKIAAIYEGPIIVFEGSACILIGGRWIAIPADHTCP